MLSNDLIHQEIKNLKDGKFAIILLNMGGPQNLGEVKPFLNKLFADADLIQLPFYLKPFQGLIAKIITKSRYKVTQKMYQKIGGGSPIVEITKNFASNISDEFETGVVVKSVMRYSQPSSEQVIKQLEKLGVEKIILFSQYPYNSSATTGSSVKDFVKFFKRSNLKDRCKVRILDDWGLEHAYTRWWVRGIIKELKKLKDLGIDLDKKIHVVFTVHGLPKSYIERGDKYKDQVEVSMVKIVDEVKDNGYSPTFHLSYQSKVGPVEWIRPYTEDIIKEVSAIAEAMIMVPLGFVSNHVETLYEIDILYKNLATDLGINYFTRVEVPDADKKYSRGIAKMLEKSMEGTF
ncbi:MAG: ferrochelatase [Candidatus Heimdallarchaeota archaeon]|nr:ferrochelatase [Candidatus Heimdallarchaeota archaeon]